MSTGYKPKKGYLPMNKIDDNLLEQLYAEAHFNEFTSRPIFIDQTEWDSWFSKNNKYIAVKDLARSFYTIKYYENNVFDGNEEQNEVWEMIALKISDSTQQDSSNTSRILPYLKRLFPYAAIFIATLLGAIWWLNKPIGVQKNSVSFFTTEKKETFLLPDSTRLTLNKNSKAIFSFNDTIRVLKIEGEGYLEVAKKEKERKRMPFEVEYEGFKVEVLGTKFNFIGTRKSHSVALFEGKVKVSDRSGYALMKPGEVFKSHHGQLVKLTINSNFFAAWNTGVLNLNNTRLKEILDWLQISQDHDFNIQLSKERLNNTISGKIKLENESDLYQTLENFYNLKISRIGNQVLITEANPL